VLENTPARQAARGLAASAPVQPAAKPLTPTVRLLQGIVVAGIVAVLCYLLYPTADRFAFFNALRSGDEDLAVQMLYRGVGPEATDVGPGGRSALCIAVRLNRLRVAHALVDRGANVYKVGDGTESPFTIAYLSRNARAMQVLVANDRPVWAATADNLMVRAAANGETETVAWLLDHGADVNGGDGNGLRVYQHKRPEPGIHGSPTIQHGTDGEHALPAAAAFGSAPLVRLLLDRGADVNAHNAGGLTATMCAAASGNAPVATLLLARRPDLRARDAQGRTALAWTAFGAPATAEGRRRVAALLRAAGERE